MAVETVLMYNCDDEQWAKLRQIFLMLRVRIRPVEADQYGLTLEDLLGREVVACREVGCGVVPLDRADRDRREAVGRLCCDLAAQAEAVYRVNCGIAMRLK